MSQKVSYLIIGLLSGLLLREWAVRPADSQTTTVRAQNFELVDADGNVTASLYSTGLGPALYMGRADEPYVSIAANADGAYLSVSHSSLDDPYVYIKSGEGTASLSVASTAFGAPRLLLSNSATAAGMSVNGGGGTALVTVNGRGNNKIAIGANASGSNITSGRITVENSVNRGHNVSLTATTLGGRVTTQKNNATTGRLPATAGKLVADRTATWGQIKAGEPAEDASTFEPTAADDAEFERLQREYEARLEVPHPR